MTIRESGEGLGERGRRCRTFGWEVVRDRFRFLSCPSGDLDDRGDAVGSREDEEEMDRLNSPLISWISTRWWDRGIWEADET